MYTIDKLYESVVRRGAVCVGLDTAPSYLPPREMRNAVSAAAAVLDYNKAIIDATFDACACYKVQIAYYEALGLAGLASYAETLRYIRKKNGLVIADIKRGDIADTARQYAYAHFTGEFEADFVTLSPYMGMDSLEPWLYYAKSTGKGAFVLMRTSNKGMRDFEYQEMKDGGRLYHAVGDKLSGLATAYAGAYGYGAFGAIVGCTGQEEEAEAIRRKYSNLFFLIPGYGAQGGAADGAAALLQNGNGGIVNASRSILKAWLMAVSNTADADETTLESIDNRTAAEAAYKEVVSMRDTIRNRVKE
ncbi:MAG: orotidine-5'-phosphate decarboxylase [Treponema sp.]|jgi:orotidine-5'-phosphate decarboxylase|nr:orotidine-5'-phosphate decarboxylase [Treponema sp.]